MKDFGEKNGWIKVPCTEMGHSERQTLGGKSKISVLDVFSSRYLCDNLEDMSSWLWA